MFSHYLRQYICRYIAQRRRTPSVRFFATVCKKFLAYYENLNYDPYSNGEQFILRCLANQGLSCIFDVGACVGDWALMAHSTCPGALIHCFEIVQSNVERLKENVTGVQNIIVNNFGLSDKEGLTKVRYFPDDPTHSTMNEYPHPLKYVLINGLVKTGDSYIENHGIARLDFLKIDVEGAENLVLRGLSKSIVSGKINMIQFEYGKINILTNFLLRNIYKYFQQYGYRVGKLYPNYVDFRNYDLSHEDFLGPNYIAVCKDQNELIDLLSRGPS